MFIYGRMLPNQESLSFHKSLSCKRPLACTIYKFRAWYNHYQQNCGTLSKRVTPGPQGMLPNYSVRGRLTDHCLLSLLCSKTCEQLGNGYRMSPHHPTSSWTTPHSFSTYTSQTERAGDPKAEAGKEGSFQKLLGLIQSGHCTVRHHRGARKEGQDAMCHFLGAHKEAQGGPRLSAAFTSPGPFRPSGGSARRAGLPAGWRRLEKGPLPS